MENLKWPEITRDTPLEEVKRIHQQIWDYAIVYGKEPDTPYMFDCVACSHVHTMRSDSCQNCPIIWPRNDAGKYLCMTDNGLYSKWRNAAGEEKTELACQIRDLPWRFEVEEKEHV